MTITQIGIDIGKNTFHVIGLNNGDTIALRRQFTRAALLRFFSEKINGIRQANPDQAAA